MKTFFLFLLTIALLSSCVSRDVEIISTGEKFSAPVGQYHKNDTVICHFNPVFKEWEIDENWSYTKDTIMYNNTFKRGVIID